MISPLSLVSTGWVWPTVLAVAVATTGFTSYKLGSGLKQGEWDAAIVANKLGEDRALEAAAKVIAQIEVKSEKIIQPVRTEIRTNTVYRDCKHSDDSLRNLNALITGDESPGDLSVPKANPNE